MEGDPADSVIPDRPEGGANIKVVRQAVKVRDRTYFIPCGDGTQSVKWLAMVAAQRYAREQKAKGRARQREGQVGRGGALLPFNVRRKPASAVSSDVVGPQMTIRELVQRLEEQRRMDEEAMRRAEERRQRQQAFDNKLFGGQGDLDGATGIEPTARGQASAAGAADESKQGAPVDREWGVASSEQGAILAPLAIRVDLNDDAQLAANGGLQQSMWQALAFASSAPAQRRAAALRRAHEEELQDRVAELEAEREQAEAEEMHRMEALLNVDFDDPDAMEAAVEQQWTHVRVGTVADSREDGLAIKRLLVQYFEELSDVYRHYASQYGGPSSMELPELRRMLQACKVSLRPAVVDSAFRQANAGRTLEDEPLGQDSMSLFEYLQCMLLVSQEAYGLLSASSGLRRSGAGAFQMLVETNILPEARRLGMGAIRQTLRKGRVVRFLARRREQLRRVFTFYCAQGQNQFEKANILMDEEEFLMLLGHAGLLQRAAAPGAGVISTASGRRSAPITRMAGRECFAGVQREDDGMAAAIGASASKEQLVLAEFLEAVARVAARRWDDDAVPLEERVLWGFRVIAGVDDHLGEEREALVEPPDPEIGDPMASARSGGSSDGEGHHSRVYLTQSARAGGGGRRR